MEPGGPASQTLVRSSKAWKITNMFSSDIHDPKRGCSEELLPERLWIVFSFPILVLEEEPRDFFLSSMCT